MFDPADEFEVNEAPEVDSYDEEVERGLASEPAFAWRMPEPRQLNIPEMDELGRLLRKHRILTDYSIPYSEAMRQCAAIDLEREAPAAKEAA